MATETHPNRVLLKLRETLRALKSSGAFEGAFKLQYAADKTLRDLAPEHGNSEAHALEAFDDARDDLLEAHAEKDGEGRVLYEHQRSGAVLVQEDQQWLYAEPHEGPEGETFEAGDVWGGRERAQAEAHHLAYRLEDEEALETELEELQEEETEAQIHKVSPDVLAEVDLSEVGRQVDTSVLEVMEKEAE
jgi:hypothetical protein